ncbi:MAG TPA: endonuclease/exonuclease/phosphatase family protein [Candidatus Hydrogenedentes bacterium]|nr:endonuclease/exonuclease/phosphatase family protein [Candidatus Hydrogenedentota bacterium]
MDQQVKTKWPHTLLLGLLLLFFIQVLGLWIENLYRMGLIKIAVGVEACTILMIFLPFAIKLAGEKGERRLLKASLLIFLLTRAICPFLGALALVFIAGIGVGAFLIVLCGILSVRCRLNADWGLAAAIAVLLSMLFRSWGSSIDISLEGNSTIIGGLLVLAALYLAWDMFPARKDDHDPEMRFSISGLPQMLGLFANFTIIYLILSCPAVISAWCGANYFIITFLLVLGFIITLLWPKPFSKPVLLGWNVLFIIILVAGLHWCAPTLPQTFESTPSIEGPLPAYVHIPFYLMLLLSPIVLINLSQLGSFPPYARPRAAAGPVILGMLFLFAITTLLIMTNVWGYIGVLGPLLRNKFYLPFLIVGIGMITPRLLPSFQTAKPGFARERIGVALAASILGVLALAGIAAHAARPQPGNPDKPTLTIMTYNIQQGSMINGNRSFRQQLDLMRTVKADIIGLQECDTARPSGGNIDAVRYFAENLNFHAYYGPNTISGTFGAAILSRFPLENPRTIFSFSNTDEIGTSVAEITLKSNRIAFFNNHPDGYNKAHAAHAGALMQHTADYDHVIAVGDYNCTRYDSWYETISATLNNSWLSVHDANEPVGEPYSYPIDHIFLSPTFRTLESHYLPPPGSFTDHPAHWSVIAWRQGTPL